MDAAATATVAATPGRRAKRKNRFNLKQDTKGTWQCDFSVAGERVQRSTFTQDREAAEEFCSSIESDLWRQKKLGEQPTLLWQQAVELWFKAKLADHKRDLANDRDKAVVLGPYLDGKRLDQIKTREIDDVLDGITAQRSLKNGTRNRYRSFVLGVMNFCRKKEYAVAVIFPEKRKEPKVKIVWISKEQAARILADLNKPETLHLYRMVFFSFATGLRQSNVTGLRWSNVDLQRRIAWVDPEGAKAGEPIPVPMSSEAVSILIEARNCEQHGHDKLCFTYYGAQVEQPANTAWEKCLRRTDTREDFTWHCMRHTWASWHVMGLLSPDGTPTPLEVLQKLGAWADIKMVMKYAHLAPDYTARYVGETGLLVRPADVVQIGVAA